MTPEGVNSHAAPAADHAAWCPYCQKVWLLLEEKNISYRLQKVNMRCYGDTQGPATREEVLVPAA